ncbi:hypothetical protein SLEP1_g34020 [Rubroshorea leprosula]|uniref:Uncharacterized protein n=1 Tax=Rubroshorea leprosula TaxID=152421 RepID=A0AAV5KIG1_9ROSI|nr:hypothetical protein SLEP1_g34020 [Rubroshorea leprosula]
MISSHKYGFLFHILLLVVLNFILQLPPAVLGQLNSNPKPLYSFILMLLLHASLFLWIIELVYRWKRETVTRRMWRGKQPSLSFPSPTNSKPFISLADIVGLLSTVFQSIVTTVNYALLVRHTNTQIQISGWPIILAFVLLCSTFWVDWTQTDQPDHEPLHSIIINQPTSKYQDHFKETCWIFDLCSKLPSAVLDQLCSEPKPLYALILMLLSFASILLCIIEFLLKGKTERVTWSWKRNGKVPWLHPNKPFFSFWDKVGLICAVIQPVLSTVNYALVLQRRGQVLISVLPIVFALAFSCSKIWESPNMTESERNIDEEEQVVLINQRQGVTEVSTLKKDSEPTASEEGKSGLTNQSQIRVNEEVFSKKEKSVVKDDNKMAPKTKDSRGRGTLVHGYQQRFIGEVKENTFA